MAMVDMSTGRVECEACGQSYVINLPCPMGLFLALLRAWDKIHRRCKPAPQMLWLWQTRRMMEFLARCGNW